MQYHTVPTFWDALQSHLAFLADINEGPGAMVWIPGAQQKGRATAAALCTLGQGQACHPKRM